MLHKMKIFLTITLFFFGFFSCVGQNLVINGDFEMFKNCPETRGAIFYPGSSKEHLQVLTNWYSPTSGTPDYFNSCNTSNFEISIPENFLGNENPHSGNGFAGLVLYTQELPGCLECKEYLQVRLKQTLKKGSVYNLSLYISLADNVKYAVNEIGVYLSSDSIFNRASMTLKYSPQIYNSTIDQMKNFNGWTLISADYKAKGGEQFMTIGNFIPSFKTEPIVVGKKKKILSSYYFIDDVSLVMVSEVPDSVSQKEISVIDSIKIGSVFILSNILFQPLKAELEKESLSELDKMAAWLIKNFAIEIEIGGYTDNSGNEDTNLVLSKSRAKAVYDYFISKGVASKSLNYKGYGSENPIADNNSAEGRGKNRRVEIKIIK